MTRSLDQALLHGADVSVMSVSNLLINGFQNISQQNGTTAVAASAAVYTTDQWQNMRGTTNTDFTSQQVASPFPSQPDIPNGLKVNVTTAMATLAAGDFVGIAQPLEGTNLARLLYGSANAKPVTLAFMIRPSIALTGYVSLVVLNSSQGVARTYATRFTAAANTDQFVYLTIPGDVAQALVTSNAQSLVVRWCFGAGSGYQGAVNTWSGSNILAGSDVTNLAGTVGNNVIISGAVMLPGIVPLTQAMLPLLARRFDDELRLCQRYYEKSYDAAVLPGTAGNRNGVIGIFSSGAANQSGGGTYPRFAVPKRATPSLTVYSSNTGASGYFWDYGAATQTDRQMGVDLNGEKGFRVYTTTMPSNNVTLLEGHFVANARM